MVKMENEDFAFVSLNVVPACFCKRAISWDANKEAPLAAFRKQSSPRYPFPTLSVSKGGHSLLSSAKAELNPAQLWLFCPLPARSRPGTNAPSSWREGVTWPNPHREARRLQALGSIPPVVQPAARQGPDCRGSPPSTRRHRRGGDTSKQKKAALPEA